MSSLSSTSKNISKRSLTFNKSFLISLFIHAILIFGISITTYYKLPIFNKSPIINVKLADSNQDYMTNSPIDSIEEFKKGEIDLETLKNRSSTIKWRSNMTNEEREQYDKKIYANLTEK